MSNWELFEQNFEREYNNVFVPVIRPSERDLPENKDRLFGPNEHISGSEVLMNYDVGREVNLTGFWENFPPNAYDELDTLRDESGAPLGGINVVVNPVARPFSTRSSAARTSTSG